MKVKYNNTIYSIQSKIQNNELISTINNASINFQIEKIDDINYYLWINGRKYKVYASSDKKSVYVWIDGHSFKFELVDSDNNDNNGQNQNLNRQDIYAPMPGNIVKIMVEVGQEVDEAAPLLIVEAMKMETTLYSQISGKVTEINCNEKEQVDSDKILMVIEKSK